VIGVHTVVRFFDLGGVALWQTGVVKPRPVIVESIRSSDERVIVHPPADRV